MFKLLLHSGTAGWSGGGARETLLAAGISLLGALARAEETPADGPPAPDKSGFNLFHPTPRAWRREFTHDRPDINDSPHTVDAGHFQLEMDLVAYISDRHSFDHQRSTTWEVAPVLVKMGVLNWADVELGLQPNIDRTATDRVSAQRSGARGFGDLTPRLKLNLWGNDRGKTAFALIPFGNVPTSGRGDGGWEAGLNTPFEAELPHGFELGIMPLFALERDQNGQRFNFQGGSAITAGHTLFGPVDGLIEFIGLTSTAHGEKWEGILNGAITWKATADWHIDCGARVGLTRAAEDLRVYVGMSWRY